MLYLYHTILYQPLFNALVFLYQTITFNNLGLAIILLTILIRLILFPFFQKSARYQSVMQMIQPKIQKVQQDHHGDRQKQTEEMMKIYKEHRVNPFFGFLFLILQLPILIALYQIFFKGIFSPEASKELYSFIAMPAEINPLFLGLINLKIGSILMVGLAAIAQYFQGWLALPKLKKGENQPAAQKMGRQMVYIAPIITLVIFYKLPSAVSLYWFVSSLFSIFQQLIINKELSNGKLGTMD